MSLTPGGGGGRRGAGRALLADVDRESKPLSGTRPRVSPVLARPVIAVGVPRSIPRMLVVALLEAGRHRDLYALLEEYWRHDPENLELARSLLVLERYFQWEALARGQGATPADDPASGEGGAHASGATG